MESSCLLDSVLCSASWLFTVRTHETSSVLRRKYHVPLLSILLPFKLIFFVVLRMVG